MKKGMDETTKELRDLVASLYADRLREALQRIDDSPLHGSCHVEPFGILGSRENGGMIR